MAKKTLTQSTVATNNIQNQPDQVKDQAAALKLAFDQYGIDSKQYNNVTLLPELQSETLDASGAHAIGLNTTSSSSDNVGDQIELILQAGSGTIPPDGTITNAKLATDVKVGSLALLDTTDKTDVVSAINEDVNNLEILRIAELDTGVADAYVVDTPGTFNRVDGNTLPFIPANNNTGASTINEDGNGVATIQKYVDGAWVALEEGDLKKFQQTQLVWNASESAFQLAPKGGAIELPSENSIFTNFSSAVAQTMNLVLSVNGEGFVSQLSSSSTAFNYVSVEIDGVFILGSISSGVILRNGMLALFKKFNTSLKVYFQDNTVAQVFYVLGKEYLKGAPMAYTATTNVGALANTINTSGKGKLISISGSGNASNYDLAIDIDGVTVFPTSDDSANVYGTLVLNWNFETSFEIRGQEGLKVTYQLD